IPGVANEVENEAVAALTVTPDPTRELSTTNWTVPVGLGELLEVEEIEAIKVSFAPSLGAELLCERLVVVNTFAPELVPPPAVPDPQLVSVARARLTKTAI